MNLVHTPCGQPEHRHTNAHCPQPWSRAWHSPHFIPDRAAIRAWAVSHTSINTAAWMITLCALLAAAGHLIGIVR